MLNDDLLEIEKPARYMGGEMGGVRKERPDIRFALAFPDVYEVGMSHLGLQILYGILNGVPWLAAERAYAPWPDREEQLRTEKSPLATLESGTPLGATDIIGFTLQYELSYTNILNMLELADIPLLAAERDTSWPLVIAGGPCAGNPEPLADFFDAFLLGDGEEASLEIAEAVRRWKLDGSDNKAALLDALSKIEGVYVPSFFTVSYGKNGQVAAIDPLKQGYDRVKRRILSDLEAAPYPTAPVIPFLKTVHDRVSLEIARGCTRGCRFCQAGYLYRPVRERSPRRILELVEATLRNTGYDEISLLSLSTGDYGCIAPLLKELMATYAEQRIAVSFPSLRVGSLTQELVEEVKKVRKTGFTLAPEAGSERLRLVINKGITEDDLLQNAAEVYRAGWRLIKLYFMIGLPTETMDDVLGIAELAKKVKQQGKLSGHGGEVNVAVSSFVPKPHTPFQWEPQISYEEILTKQEFLRMELKRRKLNFKWQDAPLTVMEGVFARGDRRLGKVLLEARRLGCRFDGWGEHFSFPRWQEAFRNCGIDPRFYLRRRDPAEILPWDHLECGVAKGFLLRELANAMADDAAYTPDCRTGACTVCGVCDFDRVAMRLNPPGTSEAGTPEPQETPVPAETPPTRIRIRFSKTGPMRFLSHLEMLTLFTRAVGRSRVPIRYSQGFHPHPKFSFATALSVGVESWAEYLDMELAEPWSADKVKDALNSVLPAGVEILESAEIPLNSTSLSVIMDKVRYRVTLPGERDLDLPARVASFLAREHHPYHREKKGKSQDFDLRTELHDLRTTDGKLEMVVGRGKPLEFTAVITGLSPEELKGTRIEKLEVFFNNSPF
ncbi:TIGR03960 family B12-binding radical SAM protein [Geomobilimonas luticola]|uniref:TIGR03960 family B12-binding radical SAM protein n=1 Tax=Geomobilimonas luticola TaxID=1114878 RepID=A0ABS5S800_9BACT|nr:TIGR03960 family B12-binding radical SAM protein [Geomobilimonas luticola]